MIPFWTKILDALETEAKGSAGEQGTLRLVGALLFLVGGTLELALLKFLHASLPL